MYNSDAVLSFSSLVINETSEITKRLLSRVREEFRLGVKLVLVLIVSTYFNRR